MHEILATRKAYGDAFASKFEDGTIVPWKPLTAQDYLHYSELLQTNLYPISFIEDEIFCKCVLDKGLVQCINKLKAGIVSHVAQSILQFSGPNSIEELDYLLNVKRNEASNILHDMVIWICQAFPGYKPDDLYQLSYEILMLRFAQAEIKLLRMGIIKEPFSYINQNNNQQEKKIDIPLPKPLPQQNKPKLDLAKQFQQQHQEKQTIITKADILEGQMGMSGHDLDTVAHQKAADETAALYPEYLDKMKRGEKISIPSVEERHAAAKIRAEANKKKYQEALEKNNAFSKVELERLKLEREKERKRKAKQRKR